MYVHWCFACMSVCMRVLDTLELEIQLQELNQGPLEEQSLNLSHLSGICIFLNLILYLFLFYNVSLCLP